MVGEARPFAVRVFRKADKMFLALVELLCASEED